jgi:predicted ribosome quality control (RQC) complex YloA/Tae2 family protein
VGADEPGQSRRALLDALAAALPVRLQKGVVLDDSTVAFEVFGPGKAWLTIDLQRCAIVRGEDRPTRALEGDPPVAQAVLRKEIVPSMLARVVLDEAQGTATLGFDRKDGATRSLVVELDAHDPRLVLTQPTDAGARVLCALGAPRPKDARDLRRGRIYEPPRAPKLVPLDDVVATLVPGEAGPDRAALSTLRAQLKAEHRRVERLVRALTEDIDKHGDPARLEEEGELLKTVLGRVRRGMTSIDVVNFEGAPHVLSLDPKHDGKEALASIFRRAKKARAAKARTLPRLEEARARLAEITAARAWVSTAAPSVDDVARATEALAGTRAAPAPRRRAATAGPRKAWRAFACSGDVIVRVGRSAKDNDELTLKHARGNDLWVHARGVVGSHVIVPSTGGDIPGELLLDAAHLAAWFSSQRKEARVDVQHTRVKHVKKPGRGAAPGFVHLAHEDVAHLRVDVERTARLLAREVPP